MGKVKKEVLNQRRQNILKIVVQEYILTGQPVASGYIVSKYALNVSPATVRNDLAYLEEHGYLVQPHLSAGRIPTDKGYRKYVEDLVDKIFISDDEKGFIESVLEKRQHEIEVLHREVARLMARITRCFGLAVLSAPKELKVVFFELITLLQNRLLLLLVLDDGSVHRKEIEIFEELSGDAIDYVRKRLSAEITGKPLFEVRKLNALTGPEEHPDLASAYLYNRIVSEAKRIAEDVSAESKIYIGSDDFDWLENYMLNPENIFRIYSIAAEKNLIAELVDEAISMNRLIIKIGQENPIASEFSILIAPYRTAKINGAVGVIGPKRMNYVRAISAARYVSKQIAEIFSRCY